jgi:hypothetical protein
VRCEGYTTTRILARVRDNTLVCAICAAQPFIHNLQSTRLALVCVKAVAVVDEVGFKNAQEPSGIVRWFCSQFGAANVGVVLMEIRLAWVSLAHRITFHV